MERITMRLNDDFSIVLGIKKRKVPLDIGSYNVYKYYPLGIIDKNKSIVCVSNNMQDFLELLAGFSGSQLNTKREYIIQTDRENTVKVKMIEKDDVKYLRIMLLKNDSTYYLEKYDCRVIVSNARRIMSKCVISDMPDNDLVFVDTQ